MPDTKLSPPAVNEAAAADQSTDVYAIYGAEPEVQAYAMAKYSRSALSMRESLLELNEQKAEKFLNTFYFQYGHRSIADLAHIALAVEKLSMLAAIALVDEQRWDGQERSTRYQDYKLASWFTPSFGGNSAAAQTYRGAIEFLFAEYQQLSEKMFGFLADKTPRPAEMKQDAYERTLRARAFDISRYLLPVATNTSLGQIVNARTLENQVSRLLSSEYPEIRKLGELLKDAARKPAYNVNGAKLRALIEELKLENPELAQQADDVLLKPVRVSPTLVKYAEASPCEISTRSELRQAAAELMGNAAIDPARLVDLLEPEPLEIELAATLLYGACHFPYRQIRGAVEALSASQRQEIVELGWKHRGKHDEMPRAFCAGQQFRFDILEDIGGFRDMHRHRRCIQIGQDFTFAHGYDTPPEVTQAGLQAQYEAAMARPRKAAEDIRAGLGDPAALETAYLIPMAYRKRTLFKMDFAEVVYISELRTGQAGHISYRRVAYEMYKAVAERYPSLAACFRVTDVNAPVDLLKR